MRARARLLQPELPGSPSDVIRRQFRATLETPATRREHSCWRQRAMPPSLLLPRRDAPVLSGERSLEWRLSIRILAVDLHSRVLPFPPFLSAGRSLLAPPLFPALSPLIFGRGQNYIRHVCACLDRASDRWINGCALRHFSRLYYYLLR